MRGRYLYNKFKYIIDSLVFCVRLLPLEIKIFLQNIFINFPSMLGIGIRYIILKSINKETGECVAIFRNVFLFNTQYLLVGNNVSIHEMCYIDATGGLEIGDNVSIAHSCTIMTTEHNYNVFNENIRDANCLKLPVKIGNDVWIGAGVRILAGIEIGDHVVIGAGAVVTKSIPKNSLAVGIPAKTIKMIKKGSLQ